ncbi:MAG TPA: hypothetical protein DCQ98_12070 [Planctomycetaceae bacterium]|nr:hypothetical protein [Planctomycetaceae bacterium]
MLSGETAVGKYPEESVRMMARILKEAEGLALETSLAVPMRSGRQEDITEAVLQGATQISRGIGSNVVVVVTRSGRSAILKSKHRDRIPTLCITDAPPVVGQACLWWGVTPLLVDSIENEWSLFNAILEWNRRSGQLSSGDRIVVVSDRRAYPAGHDSILVQQIP